MKIFVKLLIFTCVLCFSTIECTKGNTKPPPQVNIPILGKVEGTYRETINGKSFYSFEGVPYAKPPVGKYRFRESVPAKPWPGTLKAKTMYKCMQYYHYTPPGEDFVIGDEDCLYLNIYSPNTDPNANLDVIVYIHGGAFMFLHGGFQGPEYILDKDVVYINLNYRLGPLGFLSTEDDLVPGNNGIKDQILALKWIKNNVKHFGGNPESVTIMGMSAGGASIHLHYLTPKSKGLFHRGISQSGTALNPWVLTEQPLQKTNQLAATLGCPTGLPKETIVCLQRRSAHQIVGAVEDFQPWLYNPFSPFGVVVDSEWAADPVLPAHPYQLLKNKQFADLPWLISYTNSEGLYPGSDFYHEEHLQALDSRWNELLPFVLDYNHTVEPELRDGVSERIREHFLGKRHVDKDSFMDFIGILSERIFTIDIQKTVKLQASLSKSPIYFYYFTHRGAHSVSEITSKTNKDFGASHADDTSYVFKSTMDVLSTETDKKMVQLMVNIITSFVKTGKPKATLSWPPVGPTIRDGIMGLKISSPTDLSLINITYDNEAFWDTLPLMENEKLFPEVKEEL